MWAGHFTKKPDRIESWIKREPTTCGYLMCLIATFYSRYSYNADSINREGRGEGQGITLIGAGLHGQKSHERVKYIQQLRLS